MQTRYQSLLLQWLEFLFIWNMLCLSVILSFHFCVLLLIFSRLFLYATSILFFVVFLLFSSFFLVHSFHRTLSTKRGILWIWFFAFYLYAISPHVSVESKRCECLRQFLVSILECRNKKEQNQKKIDTSSVFSLDCSLFFSRPAFPRSVLLHISLSLASYIRRRQKE
jgi:hypothetical protein